MSRGLLVLLMLAVSACGSNASKPSPDGAPGGGGNGGGGSTVPDAASGGSGGSGGTAGSGGGGGGAGGAGGAGGVGFDAGPSDAPADTGARDVSPPDQPVSGTPGCGAGSTCQLLRAQYADAVLRGQSCTVGAANSCSQSASGNLGCGGCPVWVNDAAPLAPLRAQFVAGGCDKCFYGSPTGDRCHPTVCSDLFTGICRAGAGGQGSCVVNTPPAECPAGTTAGQPCTIYGWYCKPPGATNSCFCTKDPGAAGAMKWTCF